jgi:hypothetical protein
LGGGLIDDHDALSRAGATDREIDHVLTRAARVAGHLPYKLLLGIKCGSQLAELL